MRKLSGLSSLVKVFVFLGLFVKMGEGQNEGA